MYQSTHPVKFRAATAMGLSTSIALLLSCSTALADFTAEEVFKAFARPSSGQGLEVEAGSVEKTGENVIFRDVSIAADDESLFSIPRMDLREITQTDNGSFRVGKAFVGGFSMEFEDIVVELGDTSATGLYLPSEAETDPILSAGSVYETLISGPLNVSMDEKTIFSAESMDIKSTPYAPGQTIVASGKISKMVLDATNIDDADARQAMAELGYEQLSGEITFASSWDPNEGQMSIEDLTYAVDDAADLVINASVGGYTAELVKSLQELQAQMGDATDEAAGMAMLGLLQQIEINALSIKVKDESLTGRILDFVGKQQGMDRAGVTAMAKGFLPFGLAQLNAPEFAAQTTAAVSAFLDDPDSLTISAAPAEPVPMAIIMGGAMGGNPAVLLQTLNVSVTSND